MKQHSNDFVSSCIMLGTSVKEVFGYDYENLEELRSILKEHGKIKEKINLYNNLIETLKEDKQLCKTIIENYKQKIKEYEEQIERYKKQIASSEDIVESSESEDENNNISNIPSVDNASIVTEKDIVKNEKVSEYEKDNETTSNVNQPNDELEILITDDDVRIVNKQQSLAMVDLTDSKSISDNIMDKSGVIEDVKNDISKPVVKPLIEIKNEDDSLKKMQVKEDENKAENNRRSQVKSDYFKEIDGYKEQKYSRKDILNKLVNKFGISERYARILLEVDSLGDDTKNNYIKNKYTITDIRELAKVKREIKRKYNSDEYIDSLTKTNNRVDRWIDSLSTCIDKYLSSKQKYKFILPDGEKKIQKKLSDLKSYYNTVGSYNNSNIGSIITERQYLRFRNLGIDFENNLEKTINRTDKIIGFILNNDEDIRKGIDITYVTKEKFKLGLWVYETLPRLVDEGKLSDYQIDVLKGYGLIQ